MLQFYLEPCRQTRTLQALVAAAFAVYRDSAIRPAVNKFPRGVWLNLCAWLIAYAQIDPIDTFSSRPGHQ